MVGLGNVDNTSDVNKPVSTATTTALALKAPLARQLTESSIFQAELRTSTTPLTPNNANVTVAFSRNFVLGVQTDYTGVFSEAAHNTAGFSLA